jgi:hypothetical protein
MPVRVNELTSTRPIVDGQGAANQEMRSWAQSITSLIMITGTGSPETVIEAIQGAQYMDDAGTAGNILYVKRDSDIGGDKTQGWILC